MVFPITVKDQLSEDATENTIVAPFTKTEPVPEVEEYPDLCDMNYDTIQAMQGKLFVFEDEVMYPNVTIKSSMLFRIKLIENFKINLTDSPESTDWYRLGGLTKNIRKTA